MRQYSICPFTGKRGFRKLRDAVEGRDWMRRHGRSVDGLEAFRCERCGDWRLGHAKSASDRRTNVSLAAT